MAVFKCKMCGGALETEVGGVAKCEYCGASQTVPNRVSDDLLNRFNRANALRIMGEFDKAEKLYEKILEADDTQAEAYWGLILCKYGIEYVDDPVTDKKIPTCHRATYESIISEENYRAALKNADAGQRVIYEEQAREIEKIQKEILSLAQKEEPYDVFICYKETDENGNKTYDSTIANDIYYHLTNEGYKTFYAAITLEDKLGSAYEPVIFAALNSAKVMLVIGTTPEYFNAVWVKNEWSRFLKIIKNDRTKVLMPCYRDMDAYELPNEFSHLQAQDMAKIGFVNDLVRGIKKVIVKDDSERAKKTVEEASTVSISASSTMNFLKRARVFLEDGDWTSANEYCEKALDQDAELAEAYGIKLLIERNVKTLSELQKSAEPISEAINYKRAVRYATPEYKAQLESCNAKINKNAEIAAKMKLEKKRKTRKIVVAVAIIVVISLLMAILIGFAVAKENDKKAELEYLKSTFEFKENENGYTITGIKDKTVTSITIPKGVTIIDDGVFSKCDNLENIYVDDENLNYSSYNGNLYTKDDKTLIKCPVGKGKSTPKISIHDGVEHIYDFAFSNCQNFTSITFPSSLKSIGKWAFYNCDNLESIVIPDGVTSIGENAFGDCWRIESIKISASVTSIAMDAFSGSYYSIKTIEVDSKNPNYVSKDGVLYSKDGKTLIKYPCQKTGKSFDIPDGVEYINEFAFYYCNKLESINMPASVMSIGECAFTYCEWLKAIEVNEENSKYLSKDGVLYSKDETVLIKYPDAKAGNAFSIPDGVTTIAEEAFYNVQYLKKVVIPISVTKVEPLAFSSYYNSVENIKYRGSKKQWESIEKSSSVNQKTIEFNYTGE